VADGVHAYLDALQKEIISQQEQVDAKMQEISDGTQRIAFANEAHAEASREVYERSNALLGEVRSYLEAGDFSAPFTPSGLNEDGTLAEPLAYADHMAEFDAEAAAADVVEPVEEVQAEADAEAETEAEAEATQDEGGIHGLDLIGFLAAFAALIGFSKKNK
jgi:hypothetical protein